MLAHVLIYIDLFLCNRLLQREQGIIMSNNWKVKERFVR